MTFFTAGKTRVPGLVFISGLLGAAWAASAAIAAPATDTFPDHPIHIVVPYSPGGAVDIVSRLVAQKMGQALKQTVIVDNKPGGASNIGMEYVTRQPADGYTLVTVSNSLASNPALFAHLNFDVHDLAPIGRIGAVPLVVVVNAASPYHTLADLISGAQAHPGKLSFGSGGTGASGHLGGQLMKSVFKFDALHVPYKGGAPAVSDLLGARIDFIASNPLEVLGQIRAGKLRALAILDDAPSAILPNVPNVKTLGYPEAAATVWWGLCTRRGTPDAVTRKLNTALNEALADATVRSRLKELGATVAPDSSRDFGAFLAEETTKWGRVIAAAHITAE
jgi:tripartite-type tricarboxylate transporter receptor subunit TctC